VGSKINKNQIKTQKSVEDKLSDMGLMELETEIVQKKADEVM